MKRHVALMINPKNCFFREKNTKMITVKLVLIKRKKPRKDREKHFHEGVLGWLSWLSIRLQLRSWSHSSQVQALSQALWAALDSVSLSLPLPDLHCVLFLSLSQKVNKYWKKNLMISILPTYHIKQCFPVLLLNIFNLSLWLAECFWLT